MKLHLKAFCILFLFFLDQSFAQVQKIDLPKGLYAFTFQEDRDGRIWVGLSDGSVSGALGVVENNSIRLVSDESDIPQGSYHASLKFPDGSLIFGGNLMNTSAKPLLVWVTPTGIDTLQIPFVLANPLVNSISIANRHELWIGTSSGLVVNSRGEWKRYTTRDGLPDNFVSAIHQDFRGIIWVATDLGVAFFLDGKLYQTEPTSRIIRSATQLFEDNRGYVWCGARFASEGISVYNGQIWETFTARHGLVDNSSSIFYQDDNGRLWAGSCFNRSRGGVSMFNGRQWKNYSHPVYLAKPCVDAIVTDQSGRLWFAGSLSSRRAQGITILDGEEWHIVSNSEILPVDRVIAFYRDSSGNLWISSFEGLYVLSHEFNPLDH